MSAIQTKNIIKRYANNILANDNISIEIPQNKVTAIIGENGAGKTTLMKILYGMEQPDSGEIYLSGKQVKLKSPHVAIQHGIGMVSQHFMLVSSLTVAENVFLGNEPQKSGCFLDYQKANKDIQIYSKIYGFNLQPEIKINDLSVGDKQKVEILKLLVRKSKIFIFDEPTATLTDDESLKFYEIVEKLIANHNTVILISHKITEIMEHANIFIVMKSGRVMKSFTRDEVINSKVITDLMFDQMEAKAKITNTMIKKNQIVLKLDRISYLNQNGKKILDNIGFQVEKGSILGVAGVEGGGQNELAMLIINLLQSNSGSLYFQGKNIKGYSTYSLRNIGISYIPEDRMEYAVSLESSIRDNLLSPALFKRAKYYERKKIDQLVIHLIKEYEISCTSMHQKVSELSGGNIQKVVIAREFSFEPKLVIASQITRGVDMYSTNFIHDKIRELSDRGTSFVIISSDLSEIKKLADKILVLFEGKVHALMENTEEISINDLGKCIVGIK